MMGASIAKLDNDCPTLPTNLLSKRFSSSLTKRLFAYMAKKPYCSAHKNSSLILPQEKAIHFPYIQLNNPVNQAWITIDIDGPQARKFTNQFAFEALGVPIPNFVLQRPSNGHIQAVYAIEPVAIHKNARLGPKLFLKSVRDSLVSSIPGADASCHSSKLWNPFSNDWTRFEFHSQEYSLSELSEGLPRQFTMSLGNNVQEKKNEKDDLIHYAYKGERNDLLFNALRRWAYVHLSHAKRDLNYDQWVSLINQKGISINSQFCIPALRRNEVRSTSKSIAKWVWDRYQGRAGIGIMALDKDLPLSERQALAGKHSSKVRVTQTQRLIKDAIKALLVAGKPTTYKNIAEASGRAERTIARHSEFVSSAIAEIQNEIAQEQHKTNMTNGTYQLTARQGSFNNSASHCFDLRLISILSCLDLSCSVLLCLDLYLRTYSLYDVLLE